MISYAKSEDFYEIKELFIECFPEHSDFNEYFFEKLYEKENCILIKDNEKIVSMLQMLKYKSSYGDVTYIFGVATSKNHRKKGYAEKLMQKSFDISKSLGHKFSVLIPAKDWLYDFYAKYGYKATFSCDVVSCKNENVENISRFMQKEDICDVIQIYNNADKGDFYINRDERFFEIQMDLYGEGAKVYIENSRIIGYSFGYFEEDVYIIDEIFSVDILKCVKTFSKTIYKTYGKSEKLGVIKSLEEDVMPNGYLNLMYN